MVVVVPPSAVAALVRVAASAVAIATAEALPLLSQSLLDSSEECRRIQEEVEEEGVRHFSSSPAERWKQRRRSLLSTSVAMATVREGWRTGAVASAIDPPLALTHGPPLTCSRGVGVALQRPASVVHRQVLRVAVSPP
jgi:hypothetical protein